MATPPFVPPSTAKHSAVIPAAFQPPMTRGGGVIGRRRFVFDAFWHLRLQSGLLLASKSAGLWRGSTKAVAGICQIWRGFARGEWANIPKERCQKT